MKAAAINSLPGWFRPVAAILDWGMPHGKNLTYLLIGLDCVWAMPYSIVKMQPIPASVLQLVGVVFGIGAGAAVGLAHAKKPTVADAALDANPAGIK